MRKRKVWDCEYMPYEDFLKVASIRREHYIHFCWRDSNGIYQVFMDDFMWMTDEEAFRYVYKYYIADKKQNPKPTSEHTKGRWIYPTITNWNSPTEDLILEKCQCEAMTGY